MASTTQSDGGRESARLMKGGRMPSEVSRAAIRAEMLLIHDYLQYLAGALAEGDVAEAANFAGEVKDHAVRISNTLRDAEERGMVAR